MEKFGPARTRRAELADQPEYVDQILKSGVKQARKIALPLVREVRDAVGIPNP
jgi:tryptophanyl-tRNA synthetase